jgi:UDP-glucuronate 4-epimerase
MRILVTGGAGFIGSHIADALLNRGDSVTILDNLNTFYDPALKRANLDEVRANGGDRVRVIIGDLADQAARTKALDGVDAVIHLAAWAGVRPSIEQPALYVEQNLLLPTLLVNSMRAAGITRLVWASSSSVYGDTCTPPFSETANVNAPVSPYAATKLGGEALAATFCHLYGMNITSLRFFTVYGPRQRPEMAIHKFARRIKQGRAIPRFGDGSTFRDYTYIDDIVQGAIAAIDRVDGCRVYNLGESQTVTLNELIAGIGEALGIEPVIETLPLQPGDVMGTNADITRARNELGYNPQVATAEGLRRFAEWFLKRPHLWQSEE